MENKQEMSALKSLLNSPLRNIPAVPTPDWTSADNAVTPVPTTSVVATASVEPTSSVGPPSLVVPIASGSKVPPQSQMVAVMPSIIHDPHNSITIQNCVATLNVNCELNLKTINFRTRNSEYNPGRFHGVIMRIREPRATGLIFKSGKIVCTGARSEADALLASKKFAKILQRIGFKVRCTNFKIQNMVATCDLRFPIKLENLNQMHGQFSSYEPELFPGLIYRMVKPRLVLLIFVNGKLVLTGAKGREDLTDALDNIYPILKSFRKN